MQKDMEYFYSSKKYILAAVAVFTVSFAAGVMISEIYPGYLFSWDEIPGNDSGKLVEFLGQNYGISWVKTAKIEKIDDGRLIIVSTEEKSLSLRLNNDKTKVNLKIDDGRTFELNTTMENNKLNIYYPGASEKLLEMMKETFGGITSLDPFERMLEIFKNNVRTSFIALLLGLGFGIIPFIIVAINGAVLGILVELFIKKQGAFFVIAAILPHGIIELPMVLISVGVGFRLGHIAYLSLKRLKTMHELIHELKLGVFFYIKIVAPLLLLAAIVESYVTPLFIYTFIK